MANSFVNPRPGSTLRMYSFLYTYLNDTAVEEFITDQKACLDASFHRKRQNLDESRSSKT